MIVDLPDPDEPTSAVTVPGSRIKADSVQNGLLRRRTQTPHPQSAPCPESAASCSMPPRRLVLFQFRHDLAGAVEPGERFSQLRADIHDLKHRRNHEGEKHVVAEVVARPSRYCRARDDRPATSPIAETSPSTVVDAEPTARWSWSATSSRFSAAVPRRRQTPRFALFRMVALDHAHAAQRLCQPARHFGVDLARARGRSDESS